MLVKRPLLRLNQLLDRFLRRLAEVPGRFSPNDSLKCWFLFDERNEGAGAVDVVVDMMDGDSARCRKLPLDVSGR